VTAVDASEPALEQLRLNAELNGLSNIRAVRSDVFDFLDAGGEAYDLIILDPPPFVKRKGDLRSGIAGYTRLNAAALDRLAPGGRLLTFSCSHHVALPDFTDAVRRAARGTDRRLRLASMLDQGPDHPHLLKVPESGYLKGLVVEAMD
jgi:23S rRNA (cytosine1962-C5)-methyltransferase